MPEEYTIDFEVTGIKLPVEQILATSALADEHECWKTGQTMGGQRVATTSGIRIVIAKRLDKKSAEEALSTFLRDHAAFLDTLKELTPVREQQFIRCVMCVYSDNASYFELSASVLRELSRTGTEFVIAAWPCNFPEEPPSLSPRRATSTS